MISDPENRPEFPPTRWSLVLADGAGRDIAMEELCRLYWFPLYAFLRNRGMPGPDAEDVTQGFFARMLDNGRLQKIDPGTGRLRSYLIGALKNHVSNWQRHENAEKRGGRVEHVPFDLIDFSDAEKRYSGAAGDNFDAQWALQVLRLATERLAEEMRESGREKIFDTLRPMLVPHPVERSYEDAGTTLGISEGAVRVAVHRLRNRFREILRSQVADTLQSDDLVDEELQSIYQALTGLAQSDQLSV